MSGVEKGKPTRGKRGSAPEPGGKRESTSKPDDQPEQARSKKDFVPAARHRSNITHLGSTEAHEETVGLLVEAQAASSVFHGMTDDLETLAECLHFMQQTMPKLKKLKDTGPLTYVLGTNISQDLGQRTIKMSQNIYIEEMARELLPEADLISRNRASQGLGSSTAIRRMNQNKYICKVNSIVL